MKAFSKKELILIIEGDGNNIRKDRVLNDLKIKYKKEGDREKTCNFIVFLA